MSDVDSLVVKLGADLTTFRAEMLAGQKVVQDAAANIDKSLGDMAKKSGSSFDGLKQAAATALGFIGGEAILGAFKKATEAAVEFFKAGIDEASKQEDAINKLNQSLAQSGKYSKAASQDLQDFASSMQQTTKYSDDAVLGVSSLIESLGQLSGTQLKQATKAALDMSQALGIDAATAARTLGKAAAGEISGLTKFGVIVREGATKAETLTNALTALNSKFGGAAANAVLTYSGATAQLSNNISDTEKELGLAFTKSNAVIGVTNVLSHAFAELADYIADNRDVIQEFVAEVITLAAKGIPYLVAGVQKMVEAFTATYRIVQSVKGVFYDLIGDAEKSQEAVDKIFESQQNDNKRAETFATIGKAAEDLTGKIIKAAQSQGSAQDSINAGLEKQSQLAALNLAAQDALTDKEQKRLQAAIDSGAKIIDAKEVEATNQYDILERRILAENEANAAAREQNLISEAEYQTQVTNIAKKSEQDRTKVKESESVRRNEIEKKTLTATSKILGDTAAVAQAFGQRGFDTYKDLTKAQTLIDTYAAAQGAFRATIGIPFIGPVLAPIAAAAAIGAGLARVAQINATNYAQGGEVPGIGFLDSHPANLTPGENVVDRSTNKKLNNFLDGDTAMTAALGRIENAVKDLGGLLSGKFQIVNADGKWMFDMINDGLVQGRRLRIGEST